MDVYEQIESIRRIRWARPDLSWGLVPTMGYLHEGHLSLIRQARAENDRIAVSIFVNPIQFNNAGDLNSYPRDLNRDLRLLEQEGADLVWIPASDIMYPDSFQTYVDVEKVTLPLEGAKRPGHFRGVTTVVAKLFNVIQPHQAYFGQKDAQQLAVIRQMTHDLNFNVEIVPCPTIREADGLAMSSRNTNLTPGARKQAVRLFNALTAAKQAIVNGERNGDSIRQLMSDNINQAKLARIDYVSVADPTSLQELDQITSEALISLAVYFHDVRLIDNMLIKIK